MYNLPYFKEKDLQVVLRFIKEHPFAMLIGSAKNVPVATQLPFLIEESEGKLFLQGHLMRNTDHHKALTANPQVLCVFTGPHTYVSASWYTNQQTASTWNYMSVHIQGTIRFCSEEALLEILEKTTTLFENNPQSPASFSNLPKEYIDRLKGAIIGFRIEVTGIENVFKLSQNRDRESYQHIIEQLMVKGKEAQEIAAEMKKRTAELFT